MYSFVLFIVFNHCVYELGSHEKVLYRKEDVAREKTQFFQKNVFLGGKNTERNGVFSRLFKISAFLEPLIALSGNLVRKILLEKSCSSHHVREIVYEKSCSKIPVRHFLFEKSCTKNPVRIIPFEKSRTKCLVRKLPLDCRMKNAVREILYEKSCAKKSYR